MTFGLRADMGRWSNALVRLNEDVNADLKGRDIDDPAVAKALERFVKGLDMATDALTAAFLALDPKAIAETGRANTEPGTDA